MTLVKKIILTFLFSILFITAINIIAFYFFYSLYIQAYLGNKVESRENITIEYINELIEKQALEEVDNIFNDIELQFFELLNKNEWNIPLNEQKNIEIVLNYLVKSWVTPKYFQDLIGENSLEQVILNFQDKQSPEYIFLNRLISSLLVTNLIAIIILVFCFFVLAKVIILPIQKTTQNIKNLKIWKDFKIIQYNKNDEIWLLVNALNELNKKLSIWESIRNRLLADISHELKTPITSIQCYMEWIKDWVISLDNKTLDSILYEMQRLIKLVNKVMDFEKYDTSELQLNIKNEDIRYITEQVINQFREKLKANNQKVITSWLNKKIATDKDSFIQIVQNIISNFIKYAWKWTILKIEFWVNYIKFSDNWVGISAWEIPFVKEKFYQGSSAKSWDIDNRWIGVWLSIIEKIISSLKWEMEIKSDEWAWFEIKIYT